MNNLGKCLILLTAAARICAAQDYRVIYTGRMLGDLRVPDRQLITTGPCSPALQPNAPAQQFLDMTARWRSEAGPTILVSMGDNFSPDLLSRQMADDNGTLRPKEQFDWDYLANPATWVR